MLPAAAIQATLAIVLLPLSAIVYGYRDASPSSSIQHRIATHLGALSAIGGCMLVIGTGVTITGGLLAAGYGVFSFAALLLAVVVGGGYAILVHARLHKLAAAFFSRS